MKAKEEISKKVNALIEKNNDAYKGFKKAAENAESSLLKSYLLQQSSERQSFANSLTTSLRAFNSDFEIDNDGSFTGSIHRSWMDFKSTLSLDDDELILEECIRGDKASVDEYKKFLENYRSTSSDIIKIVEEQLQNVKNTLDRVKKLEDLH